MVDMELLKAIEQMMDTKMDAMASRIDAKMDAMESRSDAKMDAMASRSDAKMDAMESKIDTKMDAMESRIDAKMGAMESRIDAKMQKNNETLRHDIMIDFNTVIENKVSKEIRLIAEQYGDIAKKLERLRDLDSLEDRVSVIEFTLRQKAL